MALALGGVVTIGLVIWAVILVIRNAPKNSAPATTLQEEASNHSPEFNDADGLETLNWAKKIRWQRKLAIAAAPGNAIALKDADEKYYNIICGTLGRHVRWKTRVAAVCENGTVFLDPIGEINPPIRDRLDAQKFLVERDGKFGTYTWRTRTGICVFSQYNATEVRIGDNNESLSRLTSIKVAADERVLKSLSIGGSCTVCGEIVEWGDGTGEIVEPTSSRKAKMFPNNVYYILYPVKSVFEDVHVGLGDAYVTFP